MDIMPIVLISILIAITIILAIADRLLGSQGEKKVIINDDKVIPVSGDNFLLNVLSDEKIFIPSACGGKATCGHCKVQVLEGGGNTLPTEDIFLSKKEKEDGIRLACQCKVKEDMRITLPQELLEVQEYETELIELTDLTHDIKFVKLKLIAPDTIEFKAGQYAQIKVPGLEIFRAYSIASKPSDTNILEFVIRLVPKGLATTYVHKALEVGDKVTVTGPYGHFYLQEDSDREIVCIAGGSGKAPIRSILYHLEESGMQRKVTYFFGARTTKDLYYTEELMELSKRFPNFTYVPALSHSTPDENWDGKTGWITDVVLNHYETLEEAEAYLCGSPGMIDACDVVLKKLGMKQENIHYDKF